MRGDADQRIAGTLGEINAELRALADVNGQIARGGAGADLLDRRDQLAGRASPPRSRSPSTPRTTARSALYTAHRPDAARSCGAPAGLRSGGDGRPDTVFGPIRIFRADQLDPATGEPLSGATGAVLVPGGVRAALTPELQADAVRRRRPADRLAVAGRPPAGPARGPRPGSAGARRPAGRAGGAGRASPSTPRTTRRCPTRRRASCVGTRTDTGGFAAAARSGTAYLAVDRPRYRQRRGHVRRSTSPAPPTPRASPHRSRPGSAASARPRSTPTASCAITARRRLRAGPQRRRQRDHRHRCRRPRAATTASRIISASTTCWSRSGVGADAAGGARRHRGRQPPAVARPGSTSTRGRRQPRGWAAPATIAAPRQLAAAFETPASPRWPAAGCPAGRLSPRRLCGRDRRARAPWPRPGPAAARPTTGPWPMI